MKHNNAVVIATIMELKIILEYFSCDTKMIQPYFMIKVLETYSVYRPRTWKEKIDEKISNSHSGR